MTTLRLAVDSIRLDTIKYQKLAADECDCDAVGLEANENEEIVAEEEGAPFNGDYRWFKWSLCFLLAVVVISLLLMFFLLPRPVPWAPTTTRLPPTTTTLPPARFIPPKEAEGLECAPFFEPDFNFTEYRRDHLTMSDPKNESELPTSCAAIRQRAFFQLDDRYPEEREFPIAFARAVFKVRFFLSSGF